MSDYHKVEGVQIAGVDIYIKELEAVDKVGIALRDIMIENLRAKKSNEAKE